MIRILSISKYKYAVDQNIFLQPATVLLSHALENLCLKTLIVLTTQNVVISLTLTLTQTQTLPLSVSCHGNMLKNPYCSRTDVSLLSLFFWPLSPISSLIHSELF